ncbi:MAG TPA: hypothetical protein VHX86_07315 [Tepidisphaeraceae bacterium]|jgi:hypothetical protein|nr:hypothetical protein [Tepidisphaeraceae bacterium]
MKFQILGQNRDTGARMTLEFQAESKAAAERKATGQGMSVHRVIDITDGYPPLAHAPNPRAGNAHRSRGGKIKAILLLLILLAVAWYFRGWIMQRL